MRIWTCKCCGYEGGRTVSGMCLACALLHIAALERIAEMLIDIEEWGEHYSDHGRDTGSITDATELARKTLPEYGVRAATNGLQGKSSS